MSDEVSAPCLVTTKLEIERPSADFPPNIWGDQFLSNDSNSVGVEDELKHKKLMEELRKTLIAAVDKASENLDLIDAVQRLGVSYHFDKEIDEFMRKLHDIYGVRNNNDDDDDLYTTSFLFRLLRQHGFRISCDIFEKFKDDEGNFKESLTTDARGMLSLYEATYLRIHGEDILDEALVFTTKHLASIENNLLDDPLLSTHIRHSLRQSIRRNIPRHEARHFLSVYREEYPSYNELLSTFAKLDFNILQKLHQRELKDLLWWWKDLDFARKLPFARDRVVECYHWILAVYFEPEYSFGRRMSTKVTVMTSLIDDIYDVYGKFEELEPFTEAIQRWDVSEANQLPEYMKLAYCALLDVYSEMETYTLAEGKSFRIQYAKDLMKKHCRAYLQEAEWFHRHYVPEMEEYMKVALVSCGYVMLAATSYVGMGDSATKEAFDWILNCPKIVKAASTICRLQDDVMSNEFEQKRGHVASCIECYMKQHGISRQETVDQFYKDVEDAWKNINEECLYPTSVSMPLLVRVVNLARVIDVQYKDTDGYTFAELVLKDFITSLLINPVPM